MRLINWFIVTGLPTNRTEMFLFRLFSFYQQWFPPFSGLLHLHPVTSHLKHLLHLSSSPDSHLSLSNPSWSSPSPSFISSRCECGGGRRAYCGLGAPAARVAPPEWPTGRRKGGIKAIWPISNCILPPQRSPLLFSIKQALFLTHWDPGEQCGRTRGRGGSWHHFLVSYL